MESLQLRVAYLLPTGRCNLSCAGCYATLETEGRHTKHGELSIEEYRDVVAELYRMGIRTFDISGGEPMIYPRILELCETIRSHPNTRIWMVSNGTRFTRDSLTQLAPLLDRLIISLDAPDADLHDELRGQPGTFEKAVETLRQARGLGIHEVAVNQLLCTRNVGTVTRMIAVCAALQVDRLTLLTYRDVSENGVRPDEVPALKWQQQAWHDATSRLADSEWPRWIDIVVSSFLRPEVTAFRDSLDPALRRRITLHFPHFRGVTAFRTTLVIKPLGTVTGDTAMANDAHFDLGHIRSGVRRLWEGQGQMWRSQLAERERQLRSEAPCSSCPRWHVCRGGCPAAARHQWGSELHHDRTCEPFRAAGLF